MSEPQAPPWRVERGEGPVLATAIHAGHAVRPDVAELMILPDHDRLREEDPFTDLWVAAGDSSIIVDRSRFELDINRTRDKAIYVVPEDAWGLHIWKDPPTDELVNSSREIYDQFYTELGEICDELVAAHGYVLVLDLHSYNHRRGGPDAPVDDPELNPEINLGTASIHPAWKSAVDTFTETFRSLPFYDSNLDVRENIKFSGGAMTRWVNDRYGEQGCSIAVEMKKIYMDEWTGEPDEGITAAIDQILGAATQSLREAVASR